MPLRFLIPATFLLFTTTLLHADTPATTLLEKAATTTRVLNTLRATVILSRTTPGKPAQTATGTVLFMHPNLARIDLKTNDPAVPTTLASNGKTLFNFSDPATYTRTPIDLQASQFSEPWWNLPARFFFSQNPLFSDQTSSPASPTPASPPRSSLTRPSTAQPTESSQSTAPSLDPTLHLAINHSPWTKLAWQKTPLTNPFEPHNEQR